MASLKQYLQEKSDGQFHTFTLETAPDVEVTIRRIKVKERNELMSRYEGKPERERNVGITIGLIALSVVPAMSESDVEQLDAAIADEIGQRISDFHGWTEKGRKQLQDWFRPAAGSPV